MTVKVAVIGDSFAKEAVLPAFATIDDAEVVALASIPLSSAQTVAAAFDIPNAYDDWEKMLSEHSPDLVWVATPAFLHAPMSLGALESGANVVCEKPMALNTEESQAMFDKAESLGRLGMVDHELRFNPNRRKIKQLIEDGTIGKIQHVNIINISATWGDPYSRPTGDWWSMEDKGGGRLGANGSHQFDLLRFWLGDVGAVSGQIATMVPNRFDKETKEPWTATADDQVSWTAEMQSGALVTVFLSGVTRHGKGNMVEIYGSEGTIKIYDKEEKLWVAKVGEDFIDMSEHDPNGDLPGIGKGIWNISVVSAANEMTAATKEGRPMQWGATFADGLKTQQAMDAVRQSWAERRWINLP